MVCIWVPVQKTLPTTFSITSFHHKEVLKNSKKAENQERSEIQVPKQTIKSAIKCLF